MSNLNPGSMLRHISQGIVAENKPMSSNTILVVPVESLTMVDGELKSNPMKMETSGVDASGKSYETSAIADTVIEAEWYPGGDGNRLSSPDVRRGERVEIYQYGDTDKYYWKAVGADTDKRKLETAIWGFSATTDESKSSTEKENMYWLEVSTHNGTITLHTSKQNGEYATYAIQINAKEGRILIADDLGNEIDFNSADTCIQIKNADGSMFEANKQDINSKCDGNWNAEVGKNVNVSAGSDINLKAGGNILLNAGGKNTLDAPETEVTGNFKVGGTSQFQGAMQANGITSSVPIRGPFDTI